MPRLWVALLSLLLFSVFAAVPGAQASPLPAAQPACALAGECMAPPYAVPAAPVWATLNGIGGGNYPGGSQVFTVFVVNSDSPPLGNVTLLSETLSAPFQNVSLSGLPVQLAPGQSLSSNITLQIPNDFAQSNFTAHIAINFNISNGTAATPRELTGSAQVFMLGTPLGEITTVSTSSSPQQTTIQSGTVSASLFYAGVAIPSLIAVILLALLVRMGRPQPSPRAA